MGQFADLDVEMVSIMVDPLTARGRGRGAGIQGTVASDADKQVSEMYEAMDASMHPGVKPGHTFVLVLKGGQMSWRWDWFGHGKPMYLEVEEIYDSVKKALSREA
jgi:hypothetical protein